MKRFLSNKRSRAGLLVVTATLIGGTGCIAESIRQKRIAQEAWDEAKIKLAALQAGAARGELDAMTELGWGLASFQEFGFPLDRAAGLTWLEKAAARGHYPAHYRLARALITAPGATPTEGARGLELLKQAASRSCTPSSWGVTPAFEVGVFLRTGDMPGIARDLDEAGLWFARSIVHCHAPDKYFSPLLSSTVSGAEREHQLLVWAQLAGFPSNQPDLHRKPTVEQLQAAAREAERLRRRVRESEQRYPAPPSTPPKP